MWKIVLYLFIYVLVCVNLGKSDECTRTPDNTASSRTLGDNGFRLVLPTQYYVPGETYTVVINGSYPSQKFVDFMLVAVSHGADEEGFTIGRFQNVGDHLTKYDADCPQIVTRRYRYPNRIGSAAVQWKAPPIGSGCVEFRATLIEYKDIWYKDDGGLLRVLCEQSSDELTTPVPECCACGVAKYSVEFKGLWSRQTHPKEFPSGIYESLLHWSNIVGASHSSEYSVWNYDDYATRGVQEVCEHGTPRHLEKEIRENSRHVRTVIITPGLWGQDIYKKASARFSVDRKKHLMSLLTMVGPSPDWCVGVTKLNLCLANCTWAGDQEIELYPWDAGTDSGLTYVSPNLPTIPHEPIHAITNTHPSNPRSPFQGKRPVKPLALLKLRRIASPQSSGSCEVDDDDDTEEINPDDMEMKVRLDKDLMMKCQTRNWTAWSECSVSCGVGMRFRMRQYLMKGVEPMCGLRLKETEKCIGVENECDDSDEGICAVTRWSDWSPCSVTCGQGFKMRQRMYINAMGKLKCNTELFQKEMCKAGLDDCHLAERNKDWTAICSQTKIVGRCRSSLPRWYYDRRMKKCRPFTYGGCKGNENRFMTQQECEDRCLDSALSSVTVSVPTEENIAVETSSMSTMTTSVSRVSTKDKINCMTTEWTEWSTCSKTCGRGYIQRIRMVKREPENGGKACPKRLKQKRKCKLRKCPVDCVLGDWSDWTPCAKTCGFDSLQERTKPVLKKSRRGGIPCGPRLERRYCILPTCP